MKTFKIHLIRHGLSEGTEEGLYIGHTDVSLTLAGKKQLQDMLSDYEYPDRSPMIFDGLIEYDFGEFEGSTADELKTDPAFGEWLAGGEDAAAPFGESNAEFRNRVCKCFMDIVDGIIKTGVGSVAIITHGGVIMTLMQYFAIPELPMHEWLTPNGCGYTLNVDTTLWNNLRKAEAFAEVPLKPYQPEEDDADEDWDKEFDPDEFVGFYTPEEN